MGSRPQFVSNFGRGARLMPLALAESVIDLVPYERLCRRVQTLQHLQVPH